MRCRLLFALAVAALTGSPFQYASYVSPEYSGWNNRRQSLEMALIVATVTKRTLIAQDFTLGHAEGRRVPYTEFFEIDYPTVPATQITLNATVLNATARGLGSALTVGEQASLFQQDGGRQLPFEARSCFVDLKSLAEVDLPGVPLIYFPSWHGWWHGILRPEDHGAARAALAALRLRPEWREAAAVLRAGLPPRYNALHFRLGDRAGLALDCAPGPVRVNRSAASKEQWRPAATIAQEWGWDGCPLREMEDAFDDWNAIGPVYISTNRPDDPRVVALKQRSGAVLWEDIPASVRQRALDIVGFGPWRDASAVSLLEQLICAEASAYLPSWPSSWETFVLDERQKALKADAGPQLEAMRSSVLRNNRAAPHGAQRCPAPAAATQLSVALHLIRKAKPLLRRGSLSRY